MTEKHAEIKRRDENHNSESIENFDQEKIDEKLILLAQLMADQCILQAKKLLKNEGMSYLNKFILIDKALNY